MGEPYVERVTIVDERAGRVAMIKKCLETGQFPYAGRMTTNPAEDGQVIVRVDGVAYGRCAPEDAYQLAAEAMERLP